MYSRISKDYFSVCFSVLLLVILSACSGSGNQATDGDVDSDYQCPEGYNCSECLFDTECDAGMTCDQSDGICKPAAIDPDGDNEVEVEVEDKEEIPMIEVAPTDVDFGSVQLGQEKKEYVEIFNKNIATGDLELQNIQFVNEDVKDFTFKVVHLATDTDITLPHTLEPEENVQIEVIYAPSDEKDDSGEQLLISSNDPEKPIVRVTLSPQYKGEARLAINPEALEMDDTPVGGDASIKVNLLNKPHDSIANRVLKITGISLGNGTYVDSSFQLSPSAEVSAENPVFLAPNESFEVTLRFRPNVKGDFANKLVVTCNDVEQGPNVEFPIAGVGIEADLEVLPNPVEFLLKPIGVSHFMPVEIRNSGNEHFPIEGIEVSEGASNFAVESSTIEPPLPWNLAPGESGQVYVSFIPDAVDLTTGIMWIQGGGTKPDYFVELRGSGDDTSTFESKLPTAIIRANGYEEHVPPVKAGVPVILDVVAEDPDGGTLLEWEFEVESSPYGSDSDLTGSGASRSATPNMDGTWTYRARVRDDEGDWSEWDSITMRIDPPETLTMVMGDANMCVNVYLDIAYHMSFISAEGDECGPPGVATGLGQPDYVCDWGPTHSGPCNGIFNSDAGEEIVWDYSEFGGTFPPELDGTYQIKVKHSLPLFGETVDIKLYRNGSSGYFWKGSHKFPLFLGDTDWFIYLKRVEGEWEEPYLCEPDGCGI